MLKVLTDRRFINAQILVVATCVIGIVIFLYGTLLYDYDPFVFHDWVDVPESVCPLEPIAPPFAYEVDGGPYTVGKLTGDAYMLNELEQPTPGSPVDKDLDVTDGRIVTRALAERTAPTSPGPYKLGFKGVLNGRLLGVVPVRQDVLLVSEDHVNVLPLETKQCLERLQ